MGKILTEKFDMHYIATELTHLMQNQKDIMKRLGYKCHEPVNVMETWMKE